MAFFRTGVMKSPLQISVTELSFGAVFGLSNAQGKWNISEEELIIENSLPSSREGFLDGGTKILTARTHKCDVVAKIPEVSRVGIAAFKISN